MTDQGNIIPTLFLPGAGGSADYWRTAASHMKGEHIFLSWPGLGDEPHDDRINNLDDLVVLVENHCQRPVNIVAQSMGGLVALKATQGRPDNIHKLVLVATSLGLPVKALGGCEWQPEYRQSYPNAARWIEDSHEDISSQLGELSVPTLLIWGREDKISPVAVGDRLNQILPLSELHIINGGDHDMALTHADKLASLISGHLANESSESN